MTYSIIQKSQLEGAHRLDAEYFQPEQIKNLLVPILPRGTQQKIGDLVRKSYEARKKSKELLEEAKRRVEEMIERGN